MASLEGTGHDGDRVSGKQKVCHKVHCRDIKHRVWNKVAEHAQHKTGPERGSLSL